MMHGQGPGPLTRLKDNVLRGWLHVNTEMTTSTGCYGMKWESKGSSVIARLLFIRFPGKGSCAAGLLRKQCRAGMPSGAFEHGRGQVSSPELSRHCSFD